jgi:hypothetical protein
MLATPIPCEWRAASEPCLGSRRRLQSGSPRANQLSTSVMRPISAGWQSMDGVGEGRHADLLFGWFAAVDPLPAQSPAFGKTKHGAGMIGNRSSDAASRGILPRRPSRSRAASGTRTSTSRDHASRPRTSNAGVRHKHIAPDRPTRDDRLPRSCRSTRSWRLLCQRSTISYRPPHQRPTRVSNNASYICPCDALSSVRTQKR